MWTQTWSINELQQIDRESRKIIKDNGSLHPAGSTDLELWKLGGRGLKSAEALYKTTKVKAAIKLYSNHDTTMDLVRKFDEKSRSQDRRSIAKDTEKYANEMGVLLDLKHPLSKAVSSETKEQIPNERVSKVIENIMNNKRMEKIEGQKWQGKFVEMRWSEESVEVCFS